MRKVECAVVVVMSYTMILGCDRGRPTTPQTKTPLVSVSRPVVDEVTEYEDFTGRTDAVNTVQVVARVTGYLKPHLTRAGAVVAKGTPLFEIDDRPYRAEVGRTEAAVAQAATRLKRLDADYARARSLFGKGALSQAEFDLTSGDRAEAKAAVEIARAERELAQLNLGFTKVVAPIAGRTSRGLVDPGGLVKAGETILTSIVSLDPIYVYFDVDESTLLRLRRLVREGKIKSRREATVPILVGLADEEGFPRTGAIDFSDNRMDPTKGTMSVRGVVANPEPRALMPGMFARVRVPIGGPRRSLVVPEKAVARERGESYVYIVDEEHKVIRRPVGTGTLAGGLRVIGRGLLGDEMVVTSGLERIRPGDEVRVREEETPGTTVSHAVGMGGAGPPATAAPASDSASVHHGRTGPRPLRVN